MSKEIIEAYYKRREARLAAKRRTIIEAYYARRAARLAGRQNADSAKCRETLGNREQSLNLTLTKDGKNARIKMSQPNKDAEENWITVKGSHVLLGEGGEVIAGMGGKFTGKKMSDVSKQQPQPGNATVTPVTHSASGTYSPALTEDGRGFSIDGMPTEIAERAQYIQTQLAEITGHDSRFNGTVRVDPDDLRKEGASAIMDWDGTMVLSRENAKTEDMVHELLHASSPGLTPSEYSKNEFSQKTEEGAIELLSQEIEKASGRDYTHQLAKAYPEQVDALRSFNSTLRVNENDYDFAKALYTVPAPDRKKWLEDKLARGIAAAGIPTSEITDLSREMGQARLCTDIAGMINRGLIDPQDVKYYILPES